MYSSIFIFLKVSMTEKRYQESDERMLAYAEVMPPNVAED
jgi:hypothetical protein